MRQLESFFWGIIAALGALLFELIIFIGASAHSNQSGEILIANFFTVPQYIIIAVFIEEFFKYLIISKRVDLFSLEKSYVVNSFFVGLGFFAVELGLISSIGTLMPTPRILIEIALIHLGTAGLMGYIVAAKNPKKISTFLFAIILTIVFHGGYNLLILKREFLQNYLIFFLLFMLVLINIMNFFRISEVLAQD